MIRKPLVYAFALICAACATSTTRTYMGYEVVDMPFTVAGGEIFILPVTDAGPIPAEDENYKIEFAGFFVGSSKSEKNSAELTWGFGVSDKNGTGVTSIVVEEIAPSETEKAVLAVEAPEFSDGMWIGRAAPMPANLDATPWLFEPETSIYVFRFTIRSANGTEVTLVQPTWFSAEAKAVFQQQIERIERG